MTLRKNLGIVIAKELMFPYKPLIFGISLERYFYKNMIYSPFNGTCTRWAGSSIIVSAQEQLFLMQIPKITVQMKHQYFGN